MLRHKILFINLKFVFSIPKNIYNEEIKITLPKGAFDQEMALLNT